MKLRYTAAWVGLTAAAMVATSACGSEGARTAAEAVDKADTIMAALSRVTDRTEDLGSAEVRTSTDLGTGEPISMDGTYSWGDGYAFDVEMDTEAAQMQQLTDSPTVRTLFVDGAYYYDIDPQATGPLQGKEWMKIDGSAVFGESGADALSGSAGASPSASMKSLKYASDVEDLGKENVNGRSTTHYRAVIGQEDMGKLKDAYGSQGNLLDSLTGGAESITMDVWVGAGDLPVRMKQEFGAMAVTMDFDKFGATKKIVAPPAAQTGDLTEEVKEAGLQQG
ncbi:hypothetical protein ACFQMH_33195 [Streptomyces viridiviolaceus]|uniref:Lipoprotein n=1 Tax=Streptomyces viridiviolaceus TaxID=68282 RepID=A0ABW2E928_9ACTN|nr:hypothetical protein [Streptomyces viridiviolaceus]